MDGQTTDFQLRWVLKIIIIFSCNYIYCWFINLTDNFHSEAAGCFAAMSINRCCVRSHPLTKSTVAGVELLLTDVNMNFFPQVVTCPELVIKKSHIRLVLYLYHYSCISYRTIINFRSWNMIINSVLSTDKVQYKQIFIFTVDGFKILASVHFIFYLWWLKFICFIFYSTYYLWRVQSLNLFCASYAIILYMYELNWIHYAYNSYVYLREYST